jgi:hypothetical protein
MAESNIQELIKNLGDVGPTVVELFNAINAKLKFLEMCIKNSDYYIANAIAKDVSEEKARALAKIKATPAGKPVEFSDDEEEPFSVSTLHVGRPMPALSRAEMARRAGYPF